MKGKGTMFKIVTFNIRCDFNQDKENNFSFRKSIIQKKIDKEQPGIICFQEVLPHVAVWLKDVLEEYYIVGCGRSKQLDDEQMTIAFKKDNWNLISMETFWLSSTPEIPGSRYENQSDCPRTCTEVVLEDLKNKKVLRLCNIHLDYLSVEARKAGLVQVLDKVEKSKFFSDVPVILTGDFNAEPDSEEIGEINHWKGYENLTEKIGDTYHGFTDEDKSECIDYIYLKNTPNSPNKLKKISVEKWEDKEGAVWLSDHYPICAEIDWF